MTTLPHILRALEAVPADPWVDPPRARGRWVGDDPRLEHRVACIVYATPARLDAALRAAMRDYPLPGVGQTRILTACRLSGIPTERVRRAWQERMRR